MKINGPEDLKTAGGKVYWDEFPEGLNPELYKTRIDFEAEEKRLLEEERKHKQ